MKSLNTALMLAFALLLLPFLVQSAGQAQWEGQINDAFSQARKSTSQMKGQPRAEAERYLNQAEAMWKQSQAKAMWYTQQQAQQQNQMNKTYMQQQNSDLFMQQQFLKNQSKLKSKSLQTINPFGDYLAHGVSIRPEDGRLHGPGTIADDPNGSNFYNNSSSNQSNLGARVLDETRQLEKSQSSSTLSGTAASQASSIKATGLWDNPIAGASGIKTKDASLDPYANDPSVVDLRDSKSLTPDLLRKEEPTQFDNPITFNEPKSNPYSDMSDERLEKKQAALTDALRETQKLMSDNVDAFGGVENDALAGKEEAIKVSTDAAMSVALGYTSYTADKRSASLLNKAIDMAPGADKIESMKDSADAIRMAKNAGQASKVKDTSDFVDLADKGDISETVGQGAIMLGDVLVKAPTRFNPTPLGAIPAAVKAGLDTGLVWTNYCVLSQEYERQEQLARQLEANRQKLFKQLQEVTTELNKRNYSNPSY
ncbi:MAG: hypothetical protein WCR55_08020 [Lentisphaerota bacterium]